jgi:hypothetical protein
MLRNAQSTLASNDREIDSLALFRSEWPLAAASDRTDPVDKLSLFPVEAPTVPGRLHDDRAFDRRAAERRKASNRLAQLCTLLVRLDGEHEQLRKMAAELNARRGNARRRALIDAFTRLLARPRLSR